MYSYVTSMSFLCPSHMLVYYLYVLVCHLCTILMYSYVMLCHSNILVCHLHATHMYFYVMVCHSYVLVCHQYVTRMYSYVSRMSLVCDFTMNPSLIKIFESVAHLLRLSFPTYFNLRNVLSLIIIYVVVRQYKLK